MFKTILTIAVAVGATTLAANAAELKVEVPPVEIVGTPLPIVGILNFDSNPKPAHPKIMVPEGTVLLSKNKPVTSSDPTPILGELSLITDGDKEASEGYEVELAPGVQWVQIDLQKEAALYAVAVWHFHRQARAYKSVVIQVSNDPKFESGVTTLFNADVANTAKRGAGSDKAYVETNAGKVVPANGVKARYVRLYSAGNNANAGNHYVEVEVYGKP